MSESEKNGKNVWKIAPCPSYDVDGQERWLSDMASKGYFLTQDGFWGMFAIFRRDAPKKMQYRLEAARKSTSIWSDHGGSPEDEAVELNQKYGWKYIAARGGFYIYSAEGNDVRELNTDPQVQALSLDSIRKRVRSGLLITFFWVLMVIMVSVRDGLVFPEAGTGYLIFTALLVLAETADTAAELLHYRKMQKSLREEGFIPEQTNSPRRVRWYYVRKAAAFLAAVLWIVLTLNRVLTDRRIPLEEYEGDLPFAVMSDLADDSAEYRHNMQGIDFNYVEEWSDLLAPRCIRYAEHADITEQNGKTIQGALYVQYYETAFPQAAGNIFRSMQRHDLGWDKSELIGENTENGIHWAAYRTEYHLPVILIQNGNTVVKFEILTFSDSALSWQEWAGILCESVI